MSIVSNLLGAFGIGDISKNKSSMYLKSMDAAHRAKDSLAPFISGMSGMLTKLLLQAAKFQGLLSSSSSLVCSTGAFFCNVTQMAAPMIRALPTKLVTGGVVPQTTRSMMSAKTI